MRMLELDRYARKNHGTDPVNLVRTARIHTGLTLLARIRGTIHQA